MPAVVSWQGSSLGWFFVPSVVGFVWVRLPGILRSGSIDSGCCCCAASVVILSAATLNTFFDCSKKSVRDGSWGGCDREDRQRSVVSGSSPWPISMSPPHLSIDSIASHSSLVRPDDCLHHPQLLHTALINSSPSSSENIKNLLTDTHCTSFQLTIFQPADLR